MFLRGDSIGKYRIVAPLGSGGFGTVYLAEDTWIDKKVALKIPHQQNLDFSELVREPRLLASLNHPNVVTVLTAERQNNMFFIVMEYVPGDTLEQIIERDGALDLSRALDYTCQICNAMDHAHRQGVIHRDLRPGNVLVTEQGMVKVADFGTSRFLEIAAHGTTVIGSPPYMAPEQFEGKAVFASDIYSLGVSMYQMLTGSLPVQHAVTRRSRSPDARRLDDAAARGESPIPRGISDIVMKAMAPDVVSRYQRAGRSARCGPLGARAARRARSAGQRRSRLAKPTDRGGDDIQARLKAREGPQARFCWHCRKPLHARADSCPFCGESQ